MNGRSPSSALFLLGVWLLGCSVETPQSVLLITVDTLRADHLSAYGAEHVRTPHIDRLASEGTLFENAISPMQMTRPAHFSLFTSSYPRDHGVLNNRLALPEAPPVLAERFRLAGFRTAGFVSVALMGRNSGAARGFETFVHPTRVHQRIADETVESAAAWIRELRSDERFFLWVHLFEPHTPYEPPPELRPASPEDVSREMPTADLEGLARIARRHGGDLPEPFLRRAKGLYAGEVVYADRWVGELMKRLEQAGRADSTLVVLTADHGECFDHGVFFDHGGCLYEGSSRVPLIFRGPGRLPTGQRRSEVVELLDVAPTLLSLSGLERPESFQGRDLFDPNDAPREAAFLQHPIYSDRQLENRSRLALRLGSVAGQRVAPPLRGVERVGVRTADWKFLLTGDHEELYHLESDPLEAKNVSREHPEVAKRMRARIEAWRRIHPIEMIQPARIDTDLRETLEALGYLE